MMPVPASPPDKAVSRSDIPVADAAERPRRMPIYRRGDRIVIVSPPGEAALMSPNGARALADLLREHADAIDAQPSGLVLPFRRR